MVKEENGDLLANSHSILNRRKNYFCQLLNVHGVNDGGNTLRSEIHKLINCVCNKKELSEEWKESIIVPIYKKGDKTDCSNYRGTSLLSNS
jgi:hypothetical protein